VARDFLRIEKGAGVELARRLRDAEEVLTSIGAYLVSQTQKAFREQGRGGESWAGRMTPNVPGIVRDMNAGKQPPKRRFSPRPALTDTGRLRQSVNYKLRGRTSVVVGAAVPYAETHQLGGISEVVLSSTGRSNLAQYLRDEPELREALGWLFSVPRFMVKVRARPFLMVTPADEVEIQELVDEHLLGG